jgi:hypothetical protein
MKLFKLFLLLSGGILLFACKKERSLEGATGSGSPTAWEFKDSLKVFNGDMDTAYIQTTGSISSIILEGTSIDGTSDFYLEIFGNNIAKGTYKSPNVQFTYVAGGAVVYESVPANLDKFSVTITNLDANSISGTFTGEVEDALGTTKIITNGIFTGKFGSTTPPPPAVNGQLTLWSKQGCGGTGNIAVKVSSQTGTISVFTPTAPACGATGAATFSLPAGNYSWEAYCNTDTVRGNVSVTNGNCSAVEVIFGPVSTNCFISNLAYYDLSTNGKLGSLTSTFNSSNIVNKVVFVDSSTNSAVHTFNPVKSGSRVDIDSKQYFNLDASGRIKDFHGLVDANDTSLPRVIITYTFTAAGYLEKAAYAFEAAPTTNILNINYTWTGGNLTKAVIQQVGSPQRIEYTYQYDLAKTAKNFLAFFPSTEIFWVQSAIDFGKNSTNALATSAINYYDAAGGFTTDNATYSGYILDTNNYIKEFSIAGDGSVLPGGTKYVLSYRCF